MFQRLTRALTRPEDNAAQYHRARMRWIEANKNAQLARLEYADASEEYCKALGEGGSTDGIRSRLMLAAMRFRDRQAHAIQCHAAYDLWRRVYEERE